MLVALVASDDTGQHRLLTDAVLGAFVLYAGSWYFGFVEGNFALLLFLATVVTGVYWLPGLDDEGSLDALDLAIGASLLAGMTADDMGLVCIQRGVGSTGHDRLGHHLAA